MTISSGQIHLDNFMETGGVTPNGQALPEPTGHFRFKFPTNNPLLTAIFNLTGRYTGVTPVLTSNGHPRNYTFDVVQDEAGKLTMTGMIDGVANSSGSSNLSGSLGSVTTVNNQPTVQFRNSFVGTGDGIPLTSRITGTAPIALTNIGGGSNALAVTASIVARVGGTPVHFRQMPILLPADESFRASAKKDWSLDLDLASKVIKNRTRTVASAQLLLPNGDTISFPERVVRYSKTRGYTLAFRRGTNITRIDRRSSITIVGLTFVKQGSDWQPTGGTIAYRFLGQKGTGQLTDFLGP
jgi:hypothetical protein